MAEQLNFDLSARPALGRDAFFVSESNAVALSMVEGWRFWAGGKLLLCGPRGAGKTHLAHVWAAESGARLVAARDLASGDVTELASTPVCVEDVQSVAGDRARETEMFHLHNLALAQGQPLLVTITGAPRHWEFVLPDLASRLEATPVAQIHPPDEALLGALFAKLFEDRQVSPLPDVIPYLARHAPRDFHAAQRIVRQMDQIALSERREVSRDLARRVLALQSEGDFTKSSE